MPLLWLSIAFLLGLLLAPFISLQTPGWAVAVVLAGGAAWLERRQGGWPHWRVVCPRLPLGVVLAVFCLGGWRAPAAIPDWTDADLAFYNDGEPVRLRGVVVAPPENGQGGWRAVIEAFELAAPATGELRPGRGRVLVSLPAVQRLDFGDDLTLQGRLLTPGEDEQFSYRGYLAVQDVHSVLYAPQVLVHSPAPVGRMPVRSALYAIRQAAYRSLVRSVAQPEAALLAGVLLSIESDLSADLRTAFQVTGTAHIVAISGSNIALLVWLIDRLFKRLLPRSWATLAAIGLIAAYTLLVGATAAVVRAAIMGSLGLVGEQIGRRQSGANTLAFCAAAMCLFDPLLLGDIGFQLSFAATLGLALYAAPLQDWFLRWAERHMAAPLARRAAGPVGEYLLLTLAAQLVTLPLILYHFGTLSLSALLANPLILPAQPLVMSLGALAMLAGMLGAAPGRALALLAWPPAAYTLAVVAALARLPGGAVNTVPLSAWGLAACYVLLGLATFWRPLAALFRRLSGVRLPAFGWRPLFVLVGLGLLAASLWRLALAAPDNLLRLTAWCQNERATLLIETPDGKTVLVNGPGGANEFSRALGQRLSPLRSELDAVLIVDASANSLQALALLDERFPFRQVWWGPAVPLDSARRQLADRFERNAVPGGELAGAQRFALGSGAQLGVAGGADGAALVLDWNRFRFLLPGGAPPQDLPAGASVILLAPGDALDQPAERWSRYGAPVMLACGLQPPPDGWVDVQERQWVQVTSDGQRMWLTAGR